MDENPNYLCIHFITRGKVRFTTSQNVDVVLGPNEMFTMWPGIPWRLFAEYPCRGSGVRLEWIRLRGTLAPDFVRMLGMPPEKPWMRARLPERVCAIMKKMVTLARQYTPQVDLKVISLLYEMADACTKLDFPPSNKRQLAHQIRDYMEQHIGTGMNVTEYARAFQISRTKLFLMFVKEFGKSPVEILSEMKLRRAKHLITTTDLPMIEIAKMSGFHHYVYFSRFFKEKTKLSPYVFRLKNKPKNGGG
jgi:AraC-like DNA-binding protein